MLAIIEGRRAMALGLARRYEEAGEMADVERWRQAAHELAVVAARVQKLVPAPAAVATSPAAAGEPAQEVAA